MATIGARFTTWEIDTSGLQQLKKNIKSLNSNHIEYGIINKEKYPANDPKGRAGKYVAQVAYDNEYGFEFTNQNGIEVESPPRPYFYQSLLDAKYVVRDGAEHIFSNIASVNNQELREDLKIIAEDLADSVRHSIDSQDFLQNHLATVVRKYKRSTEILKDTSVMYNSFSGKVVKGTVPT